MTEISIAHYDTFIIMLRIGNNCGNSCSTFDLYVICYCKRMINSCLDTNLQATDWLSKVMWGLKGLTQAMVLLCRLILPCPCNVDGHLLKLYKILFVLYSLLRFHLR